MAKAIRNRIGRPKNAETEKKTRNMGKTHLKSTNKTMENSKNSLRKLIQNGKINFKAKSKLDTKIFGIPYVKVYKNFSHENKNIYIKKCSYRIRLNKQNLIVLMDDKIMNQKVYVELLRQNLENKLKCNKNNGKVTAVKSNIRAFDKPRKTYKKVKGQVLPVRCSERCKVMNLKRSSDIEIESVNKQKQGVDTMDIEHEIDVELNENLPVKESPPQKKLKKIIHSPISPMKTRNSPNKSKLKVTPILKKSPIKNTTDEKVVDSANVKKVMSGFKKADIVTSTALKKSPCRSPRKKRGRPRTRVNSAQKQRNTSARKNLSAKFSESNENSQDLEEINKNLKHLETNKKIHNKKAKQTEDEWVVEDFSNFAKKTDKRKPIKHTLASRRKIIVPTDSESDEETVKSANTRKDISNHTKQDTKSPKKKYATKQSSKAILSSKRTKIKPLKDSSEDEKATDVSINVENINSESEENEVEQDIDEQVFSKREDIIRRSLQPMPASKRRKLLDSLQSESDEDTAKSPEPEKDINKILERSRRPSKIKKRNSLDTSLLERKSLQSEFSDNDSDENVEPVDITTISSDDESVKCSLEENNISELPLELEQNEIHSSDTDVEENEVHGSDSDVEENEIFEENEDIVETENVNLELEATEEIVDKDNVSKEDTDEESSSEEDPSHVSNQKEVCTKSSKKEAKKENVIAILKNNVTEDASKDQSEIVSDTVLHKSTEDLIETLDESDSSETINNAEKTNDDNLKNVAQSTIEAEGDLPQEISSAEENDPEEITEDNSENTINKIEGETKSPQEISSGEENDPEEIEVENCSNLDKNKKSEEIDAEPLQNVLETDGKETNTEDRSDSDHSVRNEDSDQHGDKNNDLNKDKAVSCEVDELLAKNSLVGENNEEETESDIISKENADDANRSKNKTEVVEDKSQSLENKKVSGVAEAEDNDVSMSNKESTNVDIASVENELPEVKASQVCNNPLNESVDCTAGNIDTEKNENNESLNDTIGKDAKKTNTEKKKSKLPFKIRFNKKFKYSQGKTCPICLININTNINYEIHMLSHIQREKPIIKLYRFRLPSHLKITSENCDKYLKPRTITDVLAMEEMRNLVVKYSPKAAQRFWKETDVDKTMTDMEDTILSINQTVMDEVMDESEKQNNSSEEANVTTPVENESDNIDSILVSNELAVDEIENDQLQKERSQVNDGEKDKSNLADDNVELKSNSLSDSESADETECEACDRETENVTACESKDNEADPADNIKFGKEQETNINADEDVDSDSTDIIEASQPITKDREDDSDCTDIIEDLPDMANCTTAIGKKDAEERSDNEKEKPDESNSEDEEKESEVDNCEEDQQESSEENFEDKEAENVSGEKIKKVAAEQCTNKENNDGKSENEEDCNISVDKKVNSDNAESKQITNKEPREEDFDSEDSEDISAGFVRKSPEIVANGKLDDSGDEDELKLTGDSENSETTTSNAKNKSSPAEKTQQNNIKKEDVEASDSSEEESEDEKEQCNNKRLESVIKEEEESSDESEEENQHKDNVQEGVSCSDRTKMVNAKEDVKLKKEEMESSDDDSEDLEDQENMHESIKSDDKVSKCKTEESEYSSEESEDENIESKVEKKSEENISEKNTVMNNKDSTVGIKNRKDGTLEIECKEVNVEKDEETKGINDNEINVQLNELNQIASKDIITINNGKDDKKDESETDMKDESENDKKDQSENDKKVVSENDRKDECKNDDKDGNDKKEKSGNNEEDISENDKKDVHENNKKDVCENDSEKENTEVNDELLTKDDNVKEINKVDENGKEILLNVQIHSTADKKIESENAVKSTSKDVNIETDESKQLDNLKSIEDDKNKETEFDDSDMVSILSNIENALDNYSEIKETDIVKKVNLQMTNIDLMNILSSDDSLSPSSRKRKRSESIDSKEESQRKRVRFSKELSVKNDDNSVCIENIEFDEEDGTPK